jgi:hypothetical protein
MFLKKKELDPEYTPKVNPVHEWEWKLQGQQRSLTDIERQQQQQLQRQQAHLAGLGAHIKDPSRFAIMNAPIIAQGIREQIERQEQYERRRLHAGRSGKDHGGILERIKNFFKG